MNYYEEKQERKLERAKELLEKHELKQKAAFKASDALADAIPFGQPILVGHHSEKRHRRDIERMENNMRKGIKEGEIVKYYENKIDNLENPHAISSDDPEAIVKLKEKLAKIEEQIEKVKEHNKKCKDAIHLGAFEYADGDHISNTNGNYRQFAVVLKDKSIRWEAKRIQENIKVIIENFAKSGKLEQPALPADMKKYDSYVLENLNGNKHRIKERIEHLQALEKVPEMDEKINGIDIVVDKVENRVKILFPGKPAAEVIAKLKQNGFHWSPYNKAWQRMISDWAIEKAKEIAKKVKSS